MVEHYSHTRTQPKREALDALVKTAKDKPTDNPGETYDTNDLPDEMPPASD